MDLREQVIAEIRKIYDPEIPVNIYELGLIYDVKVKNGKDACPFNYLYWNFFLKNQEKLKNNPRLWTAFSNIKNMSEERKKQIENDSKEFMNTI